MPGLGRQRREIRRAIRRGRLCECEVDAAAGRVLELLEKCERKSIETIETIDAIGTIDAMEGLSPWGDGRRGLREMAAAGMVLLENRDQTLPPMAVARDCPPSS